MPDTVVKAGVRIPPVADAVTFEEPAVSLHNERPICPHRAGGLDPISDVKQRMDCHRAGRNPLRVALIEDSVGKIHKMGFFQRIWTALVRGVPELTSDYVLEE